MTVCAQSRPDIPQWTPGRERDAAPRPGCPHAADMQGGARIPPRPDSRRALFPSTDSNQRPQALSNPSAGCSSLPRSSRPERRSPSEFWEVACPLPCSKPGAFGQVTEGALSSQLSGPHPALTPGRAGQKISCRCITEPGPALLRGHLHTTKYVTAPQLGR